MVERRSPKPVVGGSSPSWPASGCKILKVGGMKKLLSQYKLTKEELSKVIFPLKEQIRNALVSVLVVVTIITLFLTLIDFVLSAFVSSVL